MHLLTLSRHQTSLKIPSLSNRWWSSLSFNSAWRLQWSWSTFILIIIIIIDDCFPSIRSGFMQLSSFWPSSISTHNWLFTVTWRYTRNYPLLILSSTYSTLPPPPLPFPLFPSPSPFPPLPISLLMCYWMKRVTYDYRILGWLVSSLTGNLPPVCKFLGLTSACTHLLYVFTPSLPPFFFPSFSLSSVVHTGIWLRRLFRREYSMIKVPTGSHWVVYFINYWEGKMEYHCV